MRIEEYFDAWQRRQNMIGQPSGCDDFAKHLYNKLSAYSEILTDCMKTMQSLVTAMGKYHSSENKFRDSFFVLEKRFDLTGEGCRISDVSAESSDFGEDSEDGFENEPESNHNLPGRIMEERHERMFGKIECSGNCEHCKNREGAACLISGRFGTEKPSSKQAKYAESMAKTLGIALPICKKRIPYSSFISTNKDDFDYARATRVWQRDF